MTREDQPTGLPHTPADADPTLTAQSREHAVRALLRHTPLRRLWSAHATGSAGDVLALFALVLLAVQSTALAPALGVDPLFGGGYQGLALTVTAVLAARLVATLLFGAVLLGPLSALLAPGGKLDRRWSMAGADGLRAVALIIAPLWIEWTPRQSPLLLLVTAFVLGAAERLWTVARDSAAPALLPGQSAATAGVRPAPDHTEALGRLWLRTSFLAFPLAAAALVVVGLVTRLLATGVDWFASHQAALPSYVAAGLFAASLSVVQALQLPDTRTPRPRSPLEGLRRPRSSGADGRGRTGSAPLLVLACAAVAGAVGAGVALAVLQAVDLGAGPVGYGLLVLVLTGGVAGGVRLAPRVLPVLSRRRLLAVAIAVTGLALLAAGLTTDLTSVVALLLLGGLGAGVAAHCGHTLLDQEAEEARRARDTEHLHAVVRLTLAVCALLAPALAGLIGPRILRVGTVSFEYGGAAFTLMLAGALLLPVAALVLGRADDRQGVPLRQDLAEALRGAAPAQAPAAAGFFLAVEGGDGAGKSTQVEALAEWIRGKGHEVVVTREPGATPLGKRLRSILLDVSSAGLSHRAEALLYAADRAEHVESVVRPALERGAVVISDRYTDSSVAYQGAGRDLAPAEVARISRWATTGLVPHLTVLLDIAPDTARERFTEAPDRLESEPSAFHRRVRAGFLTLAAADPSRYLVVDAGQEPEAVTTVVRHRLDQVLPLSEAEIEAREEAKRRAEEEARQAAEAEAARKAEAERVEREREEQLAKLRAEEEERKRREIEETRRAEEEARAAEARRRAEEARQQAEEERQRREAEERLREEEQERLRERAREEARLRAEAEERRLEKQRRAEEALLRSERAREERAREEEARRTAEAEAEAAAPAEAPGDAETTVQIPRVDMAKGRPPAAREPEGSDSSDSSDSSDMEETTLLPQFREPVDNSFDETTPLPSAAPRRLEDDRTRELPQLDESGRPVAESRRSRPAWAEETPLDDLPTLADELLGPREEFSDDPEAGTDADRDADGDDRGRRRR